MTDATSASDQADAASRPGLVDETLDRSVIAEFRLASPGRPDFISMLIDQFVEEAQLENSLDRAAGDDLVPLAAAIDVELTRVRDAFAVELASPHESGSPR